MSAVSGQASCWFSRVYFLLKIIIPFCRTQTGTESVVGPITHPLYWVRAPTFWLLHRVARHKLSSFKYSYVYTSVKSSSLCWSHELVRVLRPLGVCCNSQCFTCFLAGVFSVFEDGVYSSGFAPGGLCVRCRVSDRCAVCHGFRWDRCFHFSGVYVVC